MDQMNVVSEVENLVRNMLEVEGSGHDWFHIDRVRRTALHIADQEKADPFIVEIAALLHDVIDDKLSPKIRMKNEQVMHFLKNLEVEEYKVKKIINIINSISFRKRAEVTIESLESKVVQDADRLDAIGAIGIARTFTYAGSKGHLIYDPNESTSTAILHFYEKLLTLKDLMNTKTAKQMAEERHGFMELFLKNFYLEWEGKR